MAKEFSREQEFSDEGWFEDEAAFSPEMVKKALQTADKEIVAQKVTINTVIEAAKKTGDAQTSAEATELLGEVDAAWDELDSTVKPLQIVDKEPSRTETAEKMEGAQEILLVEETALIQAAKERLTEYSGYTADGVFAPQSDEAELIPGLKPLQLAKDFDAMEARYGKSFVETFVNAQLDPKIFAELMHAFATTETPPLEEDIHELNEEMAKAYIGAYKLAMPGTAAEKTALIKQLLSSEDLPGENIRAVNPETLEKTNPAPNEKYLRLENLAVKVDDAEFTLPPALAAEIPGNLDKKTLFDFELAASGKEPNGEGMVRALESALGKPLDEKGRAFVLALSEEFHGFQADPTLAMQKVPSSQPFDLRHETLNRSRKIPAFDAILKKKLCTPMFGFALKRLQTEVKDPQEATKEIMTRVEALREKATDLYEEVNEHGLPAFKAFAQWLEEEAMKENGNSTLSKGEFHIGRDTKTTTYVARMANLWGKMNGAERKGAVKHIDLSRVIIDDTPRAILAEHLRQNGITDEMMGIDGGYSGSGPQSALMAVMSPERRAAVNKDKSPVKSALDSQIKLINTRTVSANRRFDPANSFEGTVSWMESLPKYTERSQKLVRSGAEDMKKYLVITQDRDASEQMMAWVVQHTVWRGMLAPKEQSVEKETTG